MAEMINSFTSFEVSIENRIFTRYDGVEFDQTAVVDLSNYLGNKIETIEFAAPKLTDIYESINRSEPINLDSCYIRDFSLDDYKKRYSIDNNELVIISSLSAEKAFFDTSGFIDFRLAHFQSGARFDNAIFACGNVLFNGSHFTDGEAGFSGCLIRSGHVEFIGARFESCSLVFKNSVIRDGLKDFTDVNFGKGDISFANTEFGYGELVFVNAKFGDGDFSFKIARIKGGRVDFRFASFGRGNVSFERTEFGDSKVDFRTVNFGNGRVNFNRSVFGNGPVSFEGASCEGGKILFKKSVMGIGDKDFSLMMMKNAEVNFEKTDFGSGDIRFLNSEFNHLILKSCFLNQYVDLRISSAEFVDLSDTIVRDILDFEPYDHAINITTINMAGMRLIGRLFIDWEQNACLDVIRDQKDTTISQKAEQFRILKVNFNHIGKYEDEDKAYIMFKRYESKSMLNESKDKGILYRLLARISYGIKWVVFDATGLYGTSPLRVLFSMAVWYFLFSIIYFLMMKFTSADIISGTPDQLGDLYTAFYHSVITFFTIGYGDHYPHGSIRIVSGIEGFVGVFLMAYFTVAFVRKVLR